MSNSSHLRKVALAGLLLAARAPAQTRPFGLDATGGIAGLTFGQPAAELPSFSAQFRQQGKPRLSTRLYRRLGDTVQLGGVGRPDSYWFRQGRFIAVDVVFRRREAAQAALARLTKQYGPAQVDSTRSHTEYYWLGKSTFVMLMLPARGRSGGGDALLGSLAMLNELVVETAVRAQARRQIGWRPDSLGLPKQLRGR